MVKKTRIPSLAARTARAARDRPRPLARPIPTRWSDYEITDGERRWRVEQLAAVEPIPALLKVRATVPGYDLEGSVSEACAAGRHTISPC
jgi:hypothetical protein